MITRTVWASGLCCISRSVGSHEAPDESWSYDDDDEDLEDGFVPSFATNNDVNEHLEDGHSSRRSGTSSSTFSEAGSEAGSEHVWGVAGEVESLPGAPLGMRRAVPRRCVAWFGIVVAALHCMILALSTWRVSRTNGYTHNVTLNALVALSLLANIALRMAGLFSERCLVEHEELLILWSCALSGGFAAFACARDPDQMMCQGIHFSGGAPKAPVAVLMSGLWSLASQLPRWHVLEGRPKTRWQLLAVVALAACTLLAPVSTYMMLSTPCGRHRGKATIWFALGFLASAQAVAGQVISFLAAGVCTGFRVVACPLIMVLACLGSSVVQNDAEWSALCWACSALFACAVLCGGIVTHVPEEICSTSVLYERAGKRRANGISAAFRSVRRYTKTWRGTLVMCAVNSIFSAWVYRPWVHDYMTMPNEQHPGVFEALHIGSAEASRGIIFILATLSFCICVVSILSDKCKRGNKWQGGAFPQLPMDRHFRGITAVKVGMIIVKTDFLMTYTDSKSSSEATIMQVVSIAFTVVCANWSVISMLRAALDISHEFAGMFRYPVTLWRASITCLLLWHSMNAMVLLCAVLNVVGIGQILGVHIPSPQHLSWLGVVLPLGSQWLYTGNELALVLSSKLANPQVFAAVQSRQGTEIAATIGAVVTPLTMLCKAEMWLLRCNNRKLGLHEEISWETCMCLAVSMTLTCGGVIAYASLG